MQQKIQLRKEYGKLRKKKYFEVDKKFFLPLLKLIRLKFKKKFIKIALYYPSNFELNVLKILEFNYILAQDTLLPVTDKHNNMNFFSLLDNSSKTLIAFSYNLIPLWTTPQISMKNKSYSLTIDFKPVSSKFLLIFQI